MQTSARELASNEWRIKRHVPLPQIKDEENASNNYGQNYRGLYCSCSRPFPDPEDEVC